MLKLERSQLWLVDTQEAFRKAIISFDELIVSISLALRIAKLLNLPINTTEQNPDGLGASVKELDGLLGQHKFSKREFSLFRDEKILAHLESLGRKQVLLMGIETPICILQSALDLRRAGYEVHVLADACGARRAHDHDLALQRMDNAGAIISTVESASYELMRGIDHPRLREVSRLIRDRSVAADK